MYYTGRLEVFNENFPVVSNLIMLIMQLLYSQIFLEAYYVVQTYAALEVSLMAMLLGANKLCTCHDVCSHLIHHLTLPDLNILFNKEAIDIIFLDPCGSSF